MIVKVLRSVGPGRDFFYVLGFLSVIASIATWAQRKGAQDEAHAERFGIFVGLWAPTFFALGNAISRDDD